MRRTHFNDLQLKALDEARFCQKTDAINRRVNAAYFRGLGHTQQEAARLANVSINTLRKAVAAFESGGIAALVADGRKGPPSALDPHVESIKAEFTVRPPASVPQAADRIEQLTGVRRQTTQVRTFLLQLGMAPRRLAPIPGKADPQQQAIFKKANWTPC